VVVSYWAEIAIGLENQGKTRGHPLLNNQKQPVTIDSKLSIICGSKNARFDNRFAVFEASLEIIIMTTQPSTAHTAIAAVKSASMAGIDQFAAGFGHGSHHRSDRG
jgi:hypothetical protein